MKETAMTRRRTLDYRTYRRRRRLFLCIAIPLIILILLAAAGLFLYSQGKLGPGTTDATQEEPNTDTYDTVIDEEEEITVPVELEEAETNPSELPETVPEQQENDPETPVIETETDNSEPATDPVADPVTDQAETEPEIVETEEPFTFENTLFIGDSRTEGLLLNTGLTEATFFAVRGLAVDNIHYKEFIRSGEEKLSVMDALKTDSWRKIYIMLGVNELGWQSEEKFIEAYREVIQCIRERQPEAEIIIQSILPVTKAKSDGDAIYNNPKIYRYNELLVLMAAEEEVTYADLVPAVADENGDLPAEGASDGVHLTKSYYQKWLEYLIANGI